jgi:glutamate synthase (NADPH) large chain
VKIYYIKLIEKENLKLLATRDVPVNNNALGTIALSTEPFMKQVFISGNFEQDDLERKLFVIRKLAENEIRNSDIQLKKYFYIPSLSTRVIVYKGMFTPAQLLDYFPDLANEKCTSAIALVHSRFSTNTFPTWDLAQPFRYLSP